MSTTYGTKFYNAIRAGCQSSAEAVVPLVIETMGNMESVVDVGCGEGWWGKAFERRGARVLGIDGDYVAERVIPFRAVDLANEEVRADEVFDLAVCLEVAEHLPPERAEGFVADLCELAPVVLFSAAMPRQGGNGHVNCQPPAYWAGLFRKHGFGWYDELRPRIWQDERVEVWYRSNLLVFAMESGEMERDPNHVQHPDLWLLPR